MISDEFKNELKTKTDIQSVIGKYVNLKHQGRTSKGLCPFHSEKSPSFTVYNDTQSYYCYGCQASGDAISFIQHIENVDYIEAVRTLAAHVGLVVPESSFDDRNYKIRMTVLEINRKSAKYFHKVLMSDSGQPARAYLAGRGITKSMVTKFGIGFATDNWNGVVDFLKKEGYSDAEIVASNIGKTSSKSGKLYSSFRNRVIFPIIDIRGNVIAFGGRLLAGEGPKYLNSSDTPAFKKSQNLFALNFAKNSKEETLILAEGYMDVVAVFQAGFDNAVATLGTAITDQQARLISTYAKKVIIAYDSDAAGQKATKRAVEILEKTGVSIQVLALKDAKDPDEYIKKFGAEQFRYLLNNSKSAIDFEIQKLYNQYNVDDEEQRINFLNAFAYLMVDTKNTIQREVYISKVCQDLNVQKHKITSHIDYLIKNKYKQQQKKENNDTRTFIATAFKGERDVSLEKLPAITIAEQGIISYLTRHPDKHSEISSQITAEMFVSNLDKEIYALLISRLEQQLSVDMISISELLTPECRTRLGMIHAMAHDSHLNSDVAADYVNAIRNNHFKKSSDEVGSMSPDEFVAYLQQSHNRKN